MFYNVQRLINEIVPDEPDPAAANALQEGLGGQFGEMRTMMQYLFQSFNFRGKAKPYRDLMYGIGTEEISHVELMATTIATLLDGSPRYQGKASDPLDKPASGGKTPLEIALHQSNIHHYLVGAQGALPVDAAGNPWSGSYVYNSGNLVLDLLYNLMLESTGRLQKCRLYEMTANKTARSTISSTTRSASASVSRTTAKPLRPKRSARTWRAAILTRSWEPCCWPPRTARDRRPWRAARPRTSATCSRTPSTELPFMK